MTNPLKMDDKSNSTYAKVNKCRPASWLDDKIEEKPYLSYLVQRNWFEVREKLRAAYPQLSAEDVHYEPGQKNAMMRAIEQKLEISPAKLQRIIASL